MKQTKVALAFLATLPLQLLVADDIPQAMPFTRYQAMMDRSPFAVATAVAAPAATPNFAKDLYVANAAHTETGDFVTIASSADKNFKKYLSTNEPEDGYAIATIEWSDKVGATKITITKEGQTATLSFNEALIKQNLASGQGPMQQPKMEQPPQAQPIVPQPYTGAPPNYQTEARADSAIADAATPGSWRDSEESGCDGHDSRSDTGSGVVRLVR